MDKVYVVTKLSSGFVETVHRSFQGAIDEIRAKHPYADTVWIEDNGVVCIDYLDMYKIEKQKLLP